MVTDVLFIKQVVESLGETVKIPMTVYCDNIRAIHLANQNTTRGCTKHIDVRYHFIQNLIQEGILKVEFVRTEENIADIFTKNTPAHVYKKLSEKIVCTKTTGNLEKIVKFTEPKNGGRVEGQNKGE